MKYWLLLSFVALLCFYVPAVGQENSFRILSFTIDGKAVENYSVTIKFDGREIVPVRKNNQVFVPQEVQNAKKITIVFKASGYTFEFDDKSPVGYNEEADIQTDIEVGLDNAPFNLEVFDLSSSSKKIIKKFKTIYFLRGVPRFRPGFQPDYFFILDPITIIKFRDRKGKKKNR